MTPRLPHLPWATAYVRSGLQTISKRVRQQTLIRRVQDVAAGVRATAGTLTREHLSQTTALASRLVGNRQIGARFDAPTILNVTGVVAPRAMELPMADAAVTLMAQTAQSYAEPADVAHALLRQQSGAEAALVLHSMAGAAAAAFAALGQQVAVACDHFIEIGGVSLAQLADAAGVSLVRVGSTGRIRLRDYRAELIRGPVSSVCRAVPHSLAISGDVCDCPAEQLFEACRDHGKLSFEILEAALLNRQQLPGSMPVPIAADSLHAGADLVLLPGDRYLGGPACAILLGRADLIERIAMHPLGAANAVGAGRSAALAATLQLLAGSETAAALPIQQLLTASPEHLQHRAKRLASQLAEAPLIAQADAVPCQGFLNDGRLKEHQLPSWGVALTPIRGSSEELLSHLRQTNPRLVATSQDGRTLLNLRSLMARLDEQIPPIFAQP